MHKTSSYNHFVRYKDKVIYFNTLNRSSFIMSPEEHRRLQTLWNDPIEFELAYPSVFDQFEKWGFFIEEGIVEFNFLKIRRELDFKHFDKAAKTQSSIIEIINGAEDIKLNGCEQKMRNKWESIQAELFKIGVKGLSISQIQGSGAFFFSNIIIHIFCLSRHQW